MLSHGECYDAQPKDQWLIVGSRLILTDVTHHNGIAANIRTHNYYYSLLGLNCGVAAADTILLQLVLSWISSSVISHVSVDILHPFLLRSSSSSSSPRWCHLQWLSSDVVLVWSLFTCPNHLSLAFLYLY